MLATDSQPIRISRVTCVWDICCASHAVRSSKSRVYDEPARAHGTASYTSPQPGQYSRSSRHSITHRGAPRSRWRQRLTRCSLIVRPRAPQPEQTGFLALSTTVTITASDPNATSLTHAPGSPSIRLNAVVTRMSPSFLGSWTSNTQQPAEQRAAAGPPGHVHN